MIQALAPQVIVTLILLTLTYMGNLQKFIYYIVISSLGPKMENMTCYQSYKFHTGYCTPFSLQRDVPDLRISISSSYRFEFQKIKKY